MAPMLVRTSVSAIKVHWRQGYERAVVGDEDEDRGSPEVSICWREVSPDEGGSAGTM